ncbi:hypothetical protein ACP70R_024219 [Stipagrostis hirtigluma subsp. patula]
MDDDVSRKADHGSGDDDLISALVDDVLLHILESVAEAGVTDLVRTDALSRRWRGLWTRVPALRFDLSPAFTEKSAGGVERFIAFVDDVLALRARSGVGINHLEISTYGEDGTTCPPIRAAEGWIRYALQRAVVSLEVRLDDDEKKFLVKDNDETEEDEEHVMALDHLPSSARLETMRLDLGLARVRLPATAAFESLVDFTLERMKVGGDSSRLLSRLTSSECCPSLQKLSMCDIELKKNAELLIESSTLLELSLDLICDLSSMELRTPNLRVLRIKNFDDLSVLMDSVPRLEEITFLYNSGWIDINGDLTRVWGLNVALFSHGYFVDNLHDATIYLLQRCSSARSLTIDLHVPTRKEQTRLVDIIKDRIPPLHHVTSLAVDVHSLGMRHSFGDGVASLLTRFNNLRCLRVQRNVVYSDKNETLVCDHPPNDWKSTDFSLAHLQEAEFRGLIGTDCELRFLKFMLASAKDLQKVIVGFNKDYSEGRRDDFQHMLLEAGTWTPSRDDAGSYEWRPS